MTQLALFGLEHVDFKVVSQQTYNSWSTLEKINYLKRKVKENYAYINGVRSEQMKAKSKTYAKWCESIVKPDYFDPDNNQSCLEDGIRAVDALRETQSEEGVSPTEIENKHAFNALRNQIMLKNYNIFGYDPKVDFTNMSLDGFKDWGYNLNKRKLQQEKNKKKAEKLRKSYTGGLFSHYNIPDEDEEE